jgi:hypothetical protein
MFPIRSVQMNVDEKKNILASITMIMLVSLLTEKKFYLILMFLKNIARPYMFKMTKEVIIILFMYSKKVKRYFQD